MKYSYMYKYEKHGNWTNNGGIHFWILNLYDNSLIKGNILRISHIILSQYAMFNIKCIYRFEDNFNKIIFMQIFFIHKISC